MIYDMKGAQVTDAELGINYDEIYFLSNHEICVQNNSQCEIYTLHGIRKFVSKFDENLYYVLSRKGFRNYSLMLEGETQQIKCKIFSSAR